VAFTPTPAGAPAIAVGGLKQPPRYDSNLGLRLKSASSPTISW
jgi:hypothetical protein